ncbi:hypothetical protein [Flammeovirga aprica]|uniref:Secretion system C-terminal sorting domain-containing protein n=1 Tax=Flammeovirga aprica JL-4 TaxID=694437 RepID=A0A7X9RWC5_9BACT|nr:hypothetical protein [Flammeovirga aprica]NME69923.1 hypothetical protein [Flammeovirga aprica JL-4]
MKKFIIISALVFVTLPSITALANDFYLPFNGISYFFKASSNGKAVSLIFEDLNGEEIYFRISDKEGNIYHEKTIISTGKVKEDINLKSLPVGKFYFQMSFEDKVMTREFFVTPSKTAIMMNYTLTSQQEKFEVAVKDEDLYLMLNTKIKGFVKLKLKDEYGETIYSDKFLAGAKKYTKYELKDFPAGVYIIELELDNKKYIDSFSVI